MERLNNFLHSIRFRLALWFALILGAALLIFGAGVYLREAQAIRRLAAARLDTRLREVEDGLLRPLRERGEDGEPFGGPDSNILVTLQTGEAMALVTPQGTVAGSWGPLTKAGAVQLAVQALSKGHPVYLPFTLTPPQTGDNHPAASQEYLFAADPLGAGDHLLGWVLLGQPLDPDGQLPRLLWTLLLVGLGTLLAALLGGYWLADRALKPVKTITRAAQEISESDLSRRLQLHSRDELGDLATTFDGMLDRLQAAFDRQRRFTADASHELRTPLTIIGLEAGRALAAPRPGQEYRRAIQVIQQENEFMTRLVGELLTLARLDAGQVRLECKPVDLSDTALEVVERFTPLAAHKGLTLQAGELPELPLQGDRQYLVQMISNLVDNAIRYTPAGAGKGVRVETGPGKAGGAWVRVSDNGPGIPTEHLPHLFERFYRVDAARSHNPEEDGGVNTSSAGAGPGESAPAGPGGQIPGSGLGLSIVEWVARLHRGSVTVHSQPGEGTTFQVDLLGCSPSEARI